jgi:hypothetical protein
MYVVEHYGKDTQVYVFEKLDDVLEVIPFNVAKDLYFLNDLYLRGYKKGELFEENAFKENSTLNNNDNNLDKVNINDKVLFGDESNFSSDTIRLFDEVTSYCNRMIEHLKIRL